MKNTFTIESVDALCALRRKLARIDRREMACTLAPLGHTGLDAAIGGGLTRGRLHEVFAVDSAESCSAAAFAAVLACLVSQPQSPLFWLREERAERQASLYPPGLAEIGIDPARMILVALPDPVALLRATVDVVRCASVGVVVIELWRSPRALDLTASRRLALAAEASGVTTLLLLVETEPRPSAAQTRWSVRAAPSKILEVEAPGPPSFMVELLRQRGRPDGGVWHLELDRDRNNFRDAALSGAVVPAVISRSLARDEQLRVG